MDLKSNYKLTHMQCQLIKKAIILKYYIPSVIKN